jgi:ATP-dependent Lon protease
MEIPFGKYCTLPVTLNAGVDACHAFMLRAKTILDDCTYGMSDAKMQLLQFVGQVISNPNSCGSAVGIHGPMGTGKTTLVTKGLSKILQRPFVMIALGGASDGSVLEGNLVTYEGSVWGKIVNSLMQCKCMNPIFYFDELDKVSDTPKGEEIIGILTHLTDLSQNDKFQDKYFSELEFDLSKALFVFSYNDESKVNPILRDRMYAISTAGYSSAEKLVIAKEHLIKNIRANVNFDEGQVIFQDDALLAIISQFCNKEKGVRTLKRCIETVFTKLNLLRLMKPGENIFQAELPLKAEFPFTVTAETVRILLKSPQVDECTRMMYG